jgi:regulator of sigma D
MSNFDYDEFMHKANSEYLVHEGEQRYGQFLMNYLCAHHPDVYDQIPKHLNPFYDNNRCGKFLLFLSQL